ncbi:MAG: hypothetical protein IT364_03560 [Candidatus Hydrogenedentes bacterium]|nr:hypothetical protein [Candidatus Hydrogenedentota bacterium]
MHKDTHETGTNPGYETRDVAGGPVFWALTTLAVITVLSTIIVFGFFAYLKAQPSTPVEPLPMALERALPPSPRLQANPPLDLDAYNAAMAKKVNSYGWVDQAAGVAHIPVDVALEIVAKKGLPSGIENHHPKPKQEPALQAPGGVTAPTGAAQ